MSLLEISRNRDFGSAGGEAISKPHFNIHFFKFYILVDTGVYVNVSHINH
ncbi:hypothetical protein [Aquimarina sp. Aq107]|nr:hypothetical protein [Aquimarina sp. Aq107]